MVYYRSYVRERKDDLVERNFLFAQFSENKNVAMKEYERFVKGRWDRDTERISMRK